MIERLLDEALQELKRLRISDGPSDENRKAQWYTRQAIESLSSNPAAVEEGPGVPPTVEETAPDWDPPAQPSVSKEGEPAPNVGSLDPVESEGATGEENGDSDSG